MTIIPSREAAFTARIAADATHEMRNVLAIVKESAGLIEDILRACDTGAPVDRDRVARAISRVDKQVGRGADLMTHLNRFAHSLDRTSTHIELGLEVEQAAFLGQRSARKRRIELRFEPGDGAAGLTADSFRVQMAISTALEWWLPRIPEGATVCLRASRAAGRPAVEMVGQTGDGLPLPPMESHEWESLLGLLDGLGAAAVAGDGGRGLWVLLSGED